MGQKANSNLLRLGIYNNEWKSRYIEQNAEELSLLVFQDIKIKEFIIRFFEINGIIISEININRSSNTIIIFISYFISLDSIQKIQNNLNDINKYDYFSANYKKSRNYYLYLFKEKKLKKKNFNKKRLLIKNFLEKIISVINKYLRKNYNIEIISQILNKNLTTRLNNVESIEFRKLIINLRFYRKANFFKEFINIIVLLCKKKNSSNILIKFIGLKLRNMKKHNYFINFIKKSFNYIINSNISNIDGLKLIFKGRLNGSPRYKKKIIQIGRISLQSLNSNIVYNEFVIFSNNGTIGLKLWVSEN